MSFAEGMNIRIVVVGDQGTGKSSLIIAMATEQFPDRAPPVLPPTRLPPNAFPEHIPLTLVDTSSRKEDMGGVEGELRRADVVVLTYACDQPESLASLSSHWLPMLHRLEVAVPVCVVGCKLDLRSERAPSLEATMAPIMAEFRQIETCLECSALQLTQVQEVFYYAQKAVLHPTAPLFDHATQALKPRAVRALKRIFTLCDRDRDGALNDAELNAFQVQCFQAPLQAPELEGVKRVVSEKMPGGVSPAGLTLTGFLFLHALFIERGRLETTWTVLRTFGYSNDLVLRPEVLAAPSYKRAPDQSVELTEKGLDFLRAVFAAFDADDDGALKTEEVEEVFSTAPSSPWEGEPYAGAAESSISGGLTFNGFISSWALLALLEPEAAHAHLVYLGLSPEAAAGALRATRRRKTDRKKQRSARETLHCFLFGPTGAGKSALLDAHVGRPFFEEHKHSEKNSYAANIVQPHEEGGPASGGGGAAAEAAKGWVLVVQEICEQSVAALLADPHGLCPCDVAAFVYDSSSEESWLKAREQLEAVAGAAESSGCEVPCLLVAAKDDQDPHPAIFPDSARVCAEMGVEAPVPVSARLGDTAGLWQRLVTAALRPHLSIPETSAQRSNKQMRRLVNRSLTYTAVATGIALAVIIGYRYYLSRRSAAG